ncbi:hypothetical protein ACFV9W_31770 [Streptomyces sp. NPDC059897]|uniref:hypothetical protein n=1 Tax=Streptomyces sp. NPDC059897 TaxID=3346994 RepID=UPI003649016E
MTWAGLAVVAGCVAAVAVHVASGGRVSRSEAYGEALAAARGSGAEQHGVGGVPVTLHSTRWVWIRITSVAVAVVSTVVLALSLGFAQPERSETAAAIAEADHVIEELRIVSVGEVDAAGSSPRSSTMAEYTVELPSADGGEAVPAKFRAYNGKGVREAGDTYQVGYAPARPELGAVGDVSAEAVEGQLAGYTLPRRNLLVFTVMAALAVAVAVAVGTGVASRPRGARRVGGDWVALRAVVTGQAVHVERTGDGDNSGSQNDKSSSRYACLTLRTDAGDDVPLSIPAKLPAAAPLLTGATGWIVWEPTNDGKAKAAADFVADDGWQLPGRVPGSVAARISAAPRGPAPLDPNRRTRLLELGAFWPRTVPAGLVAGLLVAAAAAGALLLPVNGGWRIWTALVIVAAPLVGQLTARTADDAPELRESAA